MANPTVRIPKHLIPMVNKAVAERGVRASALIGQAIRFYLSATDPNLVATAVLEAVKPLANDLRHVKYLVDKQAATTDSVKSKAEADADRRQVFQDIRDRRVKEAMERINQKSHSPTEGTKP